MPSSEVRYQRGDVYRSYDEDILRARRSSSSNSSVLSANKRGRGFNPQASSGANGSLDNAVGGHKSALVASGSEYLTKKKVEVKTTKNTEKRVQRCIVLEDGRIIEHDDPHIVVDTIEDTQTHEFDHLEDQSLARELQASIERSYRRAGIDEANAAPRKRDRRKSLMCDQNNVISGNVVRQGSEATDGSIVNDTFKRIVNTHDVRENIVRTHAAKDLGMISRKGLRRVLKKEGRVSDYLKKEESSGDGGSSRRHNHNRDHRDRKKVHKYEKESHQRVVDTEDVHQISRRLKNGQIRSETFRTEKHEVFDDKQAPDTDKGAITGSSETEHEKEEQKFRLTKTRDFTEYYDAKGKLLMSGPELTSRDLKVTAPQDPVHQRWIEVGEDRIRQTRQSLKKRLKPAEDAERTDALTKKPLDLNKEERTRQKETNKWLERHFGSDWSLAASSSIAGNNNRDKDGVRRTMSFSSIPIQYTNPGEKVSRVIKQTTTTIRPGFDKHVVSSITKSMVPNEERKRNLQASRPYHSTLTLATDGRLQNQDKRGHHASTTSLLNETSKLTWRQVPIERQDSDSPQRPRTRVQRLIDEHGSNRSRSIQNRRSYYYGEDPRGQSEPPRRNKTQIDSMNRNQYDTLNKNQFEAVNKNHFEAVNKSQFETLHHQKRTTPLYRTELLKTSNKMPANEDEDLSSLGGRRSWRDELSKSYHDISWSQHRKHEKRHDINFEKRHHDLTQSYNELPKPSQLFGWTDEFNLHSYGGRRAAERSDHLQRSKSFASPNSDEHSSNSESSYRLLSRSRGPKLQTKSYKDTKVTEPPRDYFNVDRKRVSSKTAAKSPKKTSSDAVYEFERKIPMQSSILEAQKFKTVIFVSGN